MRDCMDFWRRALRSAITAPARWKVATNAGSRARENPARLSVVSQHNQNAGIGIYRHPYILFVTAAALCARPATAQNSFHGWVMDGKTPHVLLDRVDELEGGQVLHFRNTYSTNATSISFRLGSEKDSPFVNLDWFDDRDGGLRPGAVHQVRLSAKEVPNVGDRTVHVEAAIFADGSTEGRADTVKFMTCRYIGMMLERERIRIILQAPEGELLGGNGTPGSELKKRFGNLPESVEAAIASLVNVNLPGLARPHLRSLDERACRAGFYGAVDWARSEALRDTQDLMNLQQMSSLHPGQFTPSGFLLAMREKYGAMSARYHAWCLQNTFKGVPK